MKEFLRILGAVAIASLMTASGLAAQDLVPFSKEFQPDEMGPGSTSELVFTITNNGATPVEDLAFTDTLPTAMTISGGGASTDCQEATLTAPDAGGTISLSGGELGAGASCTVHVTVTAGAAGPYDNTSSALTYGGGSSGAASDTLTVVNTVPGFSKAFSPDTVSIGSLSTLTFTIDNTANGSAVTSASFDDTLPAGVTIASPANAGTTCGTPTTPATLTAPDGGSTISFSHGGIVSFPTVGATATCQISVNVVGDAAGTHVNQSGNLTANGDDAGKATATLTVTAPDDLLITKSFTDDPVSPGGDVTLEFRITNLDRSNTATGVGFTDDLDAMLSGAAATSQSGDCGGGSFSGASTLSLTGGSIAPGATCVLSATVAVPTGAAAGAHPNTTSAVTGTIGGGPVTGNVATDNLNVVAALPLIFSKSFTNDPVDAGTNAELVYTIENPNAAADFTAIEFIEPLFVSGSRLVSSSNTCGATVSEVDTFPPFGFYRFEVSGGSLLRGATCTITMQISIPASTSDGSYPSESGEMTADSGGTTYNSGTASDTLFVNAPPADSIALTKTFAADSVFQGQTVAVTFALQRSGEGSTTEISFSDDLDAFYSGTTLDSVDGNDCGGTVGGVGTSTMTFSGGTLPATGQCSIDVTLQMGSSGAATATNTTSLVTANQDGAGAAAQPGTQASDQIDVLADGTAPVTLSKEFTDDPVVPGGTVELEFTITNPNSAAQATNILFTDNLDNVIDGLAATGLPLANICGTGSSLTGSSGDTFLTFSGGTLNGGASCTFSVTLDVPGAADEGSHPNLTSDTQATVGGATRFGDPAGDILVVDATLLDLTKTFTNPVTAGTQAALEFEITNLSATQAISAIAFDDDLDAMLTGAQFASETGNTCGGTSAGTGTGLFEYSGGALAGGASCTIAILVDTPATSGTATHPNTTTDISGTLGGLPVRGDAASADLETLDPDAPTFTKSFAPTSVIGGETSVLTFTIVNVDTVNGLSDLEFNDDLDAMLTGAVASGLPAEPCGTGSSISGSGTGFLAFQGGTLAADTQCSFDVTVTVPVNAPAGTHDNATSDLTSNGAKLAGPATDQLTVDPSADLSVSLADSPDPVAPGSQLTYTVTVDNAGPQQADAVSAVVTLPAGASYVSDTDSCVQAPAGTLTCSLGSVAAAGNAQFDIVAAIDPSATSLGDTSVTVSSTTTDPDGTNNSATESTSVLPSADIVVTKTDGATSVVPGQSTTYTIVVSNAGPSDDPSVGVSDVFPASLTCSHTSSAGGGATGNTASGSGDIADTLSLPVGASVTYTADCAIAEDATGTLSNTATATASAVDPVPANDSATDDSTLAPEADIAVTKTDNRTNVTAGESLIYEIVALNNGPSADPAVSLADTFPADLACTYTSTAADGASGNTAAGAGNLAETLSMPVGSSVTYLATCDVDPGATGTLSNTATVVATATDPVPGNDSATDTTDIDAVADIAVSKTDNRLSVAAGDSLTYEIVVTNDGPSADPSVSLTDTFPAILTCNYTSTAAGGATGNTAAGAGDLAETLAMDAGSSVTYLATCDVPTSASGTLSNTATVAGSSDPNLSNDSATDADTVIAEAVLNFAKSFGAPSIVQGTTTTATFTIENTSDAVNATGLTFSDTFPDILVVAGTPGVVNTCNGTVTANPGSDTVSLAGGDVAFGTSCTIDVTVEATGFGTFDNPAVTLTSSFPDALLISDTLDVTQAPGPAFSKLFGDDEIVQGETTVLTFTIDNTANGVDATDLAFSDVFPDTFVVDDAPAVDNQCNGTLTADPATDTVSLAGGDVAAGASCTIAVTLKAKGFGDFENPVITLTSTLQDADLVTDSIVVNQAPAPLFSKSFAAASILQGNQISLDFLIENASLIDAEGLTFTDPLPGGIVVADPAGTANACGGSITASPGSSTVELTGGSLAAGDTCTISLNVRGDVAGTDIQNVTSALGSDTHGDGDPATAMITVDPNPLDLAILFAPDTVQQNQTAILTYTFTNNAAIGATGISLTDTLPANVIVVQPGITGNRCGGTASATPGGGTVSLVGGTLAAGQSCTVVASVSSAVVGTYPNPTEAASSSLGDSIPASDTLEVTGGTTGSITIVQNTDVDATFGFTSSEPALNFSLMTENGTAEQGPIPLGIGTYVVTQVRPQGFGNVGLFCDDSDSTGDAFNGVLTIVLGPVENVTCTFVSIKSDQVTIDLINRFMTKRANLILSNQPDMARRLERLNRGFGDAAPVTFRNGDLAAMLPFTFNPTSVGSGNYRFSTSLAQVDRAAASVRLGHGATSAFVENRRFDAWVELSYQKFDDNAANEGHFGMAYAGVDYLFTPDLLVGALMQFDTMEDSDDAANNSARGSGWMFGPYMTARLAPSLYFDARLAYGQSNNFVSPFNTYTDNFDGERWLVTAGLSGEFKNGPWTIRPRADLSYYQEKQDAYVDSLNVLIPSQTVSLGQVQIGPTISGRFELANGVTYEPSFTIDGIYNFGDTSGVTVSDPTTPHTDGFRGRIKAGVNFTNEMGTSVGISGIYDGIGQSDFESLGLSFDLTIPLYKAKAR